MSTVVTAKEFRVASCQATMFTPDEEVSVKKLLTELLPSWGERFDGEPTVLPPIPGLPREVPRLVLVSRDGFWKCEVASARINVFWSRTADGPSDISLADFYATASELFEQYKALTSARVGRLAAVVHRFVEHSNPGMFLSRHFCRDQWLEAPFNRPESFELHAHKRFTLAFDNVNSWVRNKTGILRQAGVSKTVIIVEQDLNTLAESEQEKSYVPAQIKAFLTLSASEFDSILRLYFPESP